MQAVLGTTLVSLLTMACGRASGPSATAPTTGPTATTATTLRATVTTISPIAGVETFTVGAAGHQTGPLAYPQIPPVGGPHNPMWTPCAFYDRAVPNEMAVHSLEHGAIWVTYRPDLPRDQIDALATLAQSQKDLLVSRWDDGLPSPLVATAWGRQLKLTTTTDPRLVDFVRLYVRQSPEPLAPC